MDRLTRDGTLVNVFTFSGSDRTDSRTYRKGSGVNDLVAQTNYKFDAFGRIAVNRKGGKGREDSMEPRMNADERGCVRRAPRRGEIR
jgi:hypothetical protein